MLSNFAYVDRPIDSRKLIEAWKKLSTKYEPPNGIGSVRRSMLDVLHFDTELDPNNVNLLKTNKVLPNGRTDKVITGVAHTGYLPRTNTATVYTLAGSPLSKRPSKFKNLHKGAIKGLGDHLADTNYPSTKIDIHTTNHTSPLYADQLGYMDTPYTVEQMNQWRNK